jgi:hypothetical protein
MARRDSGANRGETPPDDLVTGLVADLRTQVTALATDLRRRIRTGGTDAGWRSEHLTARAVGRTALGYDTWLAGRVNRAAAAWVLGTVLVRYCEDNGLVTEPFIAGPPDRAVLARRRHQEFLAGAPEADDRDWLVAAFEHLAAGNATLADLFDRAHNPLWCIRPSPEAASSLLGFWRGPDGQAGPGPRVLTGWDTTFLGRLVREPVEGAAVDLLLDLTVEEALAQFGVAGPDGSGLRAIDPACGTGEVLLGVFRRIRAAWRSADPGADDLELTRRALASVHGADRHRTAADIARFRLLLAAVESAGLSRPDQAPDLRVAVAVADSLAHGRGAPRLDRDSPALFDLDAGSGTTGHVYATEDVDRFVSSVDLLGSGSYHAVVGVVPATLTRDRAELTGYRSRYDTCAGTFPPAVPFVQRSYQLAIRTGGEDRAAGVVGLLTECSFMHHGSGRRLVERFLPTVHLTQVVDLSALPVTGVHPAAVLVGRNHVARAGVPIRVVRSHAAPVPTATPPSWPDLVHELRHPGHGSGGVTSEDADRARFASHPWEVGDGGTVRLLRTVAAGNRALGQRCREISRGAVTGADDIFVLGGPALRRLGIDPRFRRPFVRGSALHDLGTGGAPPTEQQETDEALWPYRPGGQDAVRSPGVERLLWPVRTVLAARRGRGRTSSASPGYGYSDRAGDRSRGELGIAFAAQATHNHAVLDRGGRVLDRSVLVITLPEGTDELEHLGLCAVLNSSTACFWLKQTCRAVGPAADQSADGDVAAQVEPWERPFRFTASALRGLPVPVTVPAELGQTLDSLARRMATQEPAAVCARGVPTREVLDGARYGQELLLHRMVALQEELDWQLYAHYGLLTEAEAAATTVPASGTVPPVAPGERAFEIALAGAGDRRGQEGRWFVRNRIAPVTEVPDHWPTAYRRIVQARLDLLARRRDLDLLENPECKRGWERTPWPERERRALRSWLLDRCEEWSLWVEVRRGVARPLVQTLDQLTEQLTSGPEGQDLLAVAELYARDHLGRPGLPLAEVLAGLVATEHVPYLAALQLRPRGLATRDAWEHTWERQRAEDAGSCDDVQQSSGPGAGRSRTAPPAYRPNESVDPRFWALRGRFDVPRERFVSYPGTSSGSELLLGWAGWSHRDRAQALVDLVRAGQGSAGGMDRERQLPLLAGLLELLPWVRQWHSGDDPGPDGDAAERFTALLHQECTRLGVTEAELRAWRPRPDEAGQQPPGPVVTPHPSRSE